MGWFDEQIKQRKYADRELFEDSFAKIAGVILGAHSSVNLNNIGVITRDAIDSILGYYGYKPSQIPDNIKDPEEQLEFALRPYGIMRRRAQLGKEWYDHAFGPLLGFLKGSETPVALIPGNIRGYHYTDPNTGTVVRVNKKTSENFEKDVMCFYRPLPAKKLGIKDLVIYIRDCIAPGDIVSVVLASLALILLQMVMPALMKGLTGKVLENGNIRMLMGMLVFAVCTGISTVMVREIKDMVLSRISEKASSSVEAAVMMRLMSLPAPFFRKYGAGELSNCMGSISSLCSMMISSAFSSGLTSLLSLLFVFQIFGFAPALVVPSLVMIISTLLLSVVSSLMQARITKKRLLQAGADANFGYSVISGIQKIRLSGAEKRAFAKWADIYSEEARLTYDPPMFLKIYGVLITAVSLIGNIVIFYIAAQNGISLSDYYAFNASFGLAMGAFVSLAGMAGTIAGFKPLLDTAKPILEEEPEMSEGKMMLTRISGNIELNNIYFKYNENSPYIFNNFSLKIRSGEYVAIVGRTGCGKSTLVRLLLGFEKPEKGAVYFDGRDISRTDLKSLRRRIGVVTQDGKLFQGDIFSNIMVSAPHLGLDEAWEAAEIAGIADDIRNMPMGMNTVISEGAGGISGGQKQRLMIARAIAPKPKVLILDEATSALDNKTQKQVSDALDALKCTRIVIAHRLSTIQNCDRIVVLQDGGIAEEGTYEQLMQKEGYFAQLVKRQQL